MTTRFTTGRHAVRLSMGVAVLLSLALPARAATINWKGHTWNVTSGGMAGVCQGSGANISIDASGFLHMKITNNGGTWTAAEIFSTDKIGFGTYQWQIEGPTDKLDKNVVVGLFPYGPAGGLGASGNNEIDIEFARWGNASWPNGNYTIWPPTGSTTGSHTFEFSLGGGTSLTTRFAWSSTKIDFATLSGFVAVGVESGLLDSWTFAPANPTTRITQEAMPLGMNLWCYESPPSDGQDVEIIVRDFQFVPLGAGGDGGAAGVDGGGDARGSGGAGGADARDGSTDVDANAGAGGRTGTGGVTASGGAATGGVTGAGGVSTGSGGSVAGGVSGSGGVSTGVGGAATGGAVGTGGSGTGGRNGAGGTIDTGGAGSGGAVGTGGVAGSGGASGASGTGVPAKSASGGCGCALGGARPALGGRIILLALAACFARRRWRRFHRSQPRGHAHR